MPPSSLRAAVLVRSDAGEAWADGLPDLGEAMDPEIDVGAIAEGGEAPDA